ncbi:MAG TPA: hypothetical protein VFC99_22325 [Acidimicrobiia bacterium]|nr:hypothetical protein [Acidimicrobiia bacterium]
MKVRTCIALAAAAAGVTLVVNPRIKRWGATDGELARTWPGDDFVEPGARSRATRAVTVNAPAEAVWPWVVQLGQDRAGFYSYSVLENLAGAGIHNADDIVPEWQHRDVGDIVWLARSDRYRGYGHQRVAAIEPGRSMSLTGERDWEALQHGGKASNAWTFTVEPIDARTSRLVVHSVAVRVDPLFDVVHFVMERKMMLGIKQRAERTVSDGPRPHPVDTPRVATA